MKRNLLTLAVPAAIAASFLVGCGAPRIIERTDPDRASIVQVQEGYDTLGRKWEDQTAQPSPPVQTAQAAAPAQAAPAQEAPAAKPTVLSRNETVILSYTGTITDVDYTNREVTLKDPKGRIETFEVDKSVQRFNEAKVGDKVSVDYYLGFNAQIRKPSAEEEQNPLVVLEATGRAGPNETPTGTDQRKIRAVVTIESLDRIKQTVTVKGPRGKYFVARVADPSRLDDVRIGDTIVLTFTEAAVISLKPAE